MQRNMSHHLLRVSRSTHRLQSFEIYRVPDVPRTCSCEPSAILWAEKALHDWWSVHKTISKLRVMTYRRNNGLAKTSEAFPSQETRKALWVSYTGSHMIADLLSCVRTTDTFKGVAFSIALGIQKGFLTTSGCRVVLELSARGTGQSHGTTS